MNTYIARPFSYVNMSILLSVIVLLSCIIVDKTVDGLARKLKVEKGLKKLDKISLL